MLFFLRYLRNYLGTLQILNSRHNKRVRKKVMFSIVGDGIIKEKREDMVRDGGLFSRFI